MNSSISFTLKGVSFVGLVNPPCSRECACDGLSRRTSEGDHSNLSVSSFFCDDVTINDTFAPLFDLVIADDGTEPIIFFITSFAPFQTVILVEL